MTDLVDGFGRGHDTLRISVTDRCNLRCRYCMPEEGIDCQSRDELLSFEAITRIVQIGRTLGIDRVRLTGGEPLVRRGIVDLVGMLRSEVDLADLALTTNGLLLPRKADDLAAAGLDRINVSLDSLDSVQYEQITRHGRLSRVMLGIQRAAEVGLRPIKVNTLVLEDFNDQAFDSWIDLTRSTSLTVRFMELMPIGEANDPSVRNRFVDLTEKREQLVDRYGLVPAEKQVGNGPARYWKIPEAPGKIGFITPRSNPYCQSCSRLRLTSTGELRPCLAFEKQTQLPDDIVEAPREEIVEVFQAAVAGKPKGHRWNEMQETPSDMAAIGG